MTEAIPWPTDQDLAVHDAGQERALDEIKFNEGVAVEARKIRIHEAAKVRVQAEKAAHVDYTEQYLNRADLLNLPTPEPLIDRVLPRHAYGLLRGRDGTSRAS